MTLIIGLTGKARHGKGSVVQLSQILLQLGDNELEVRQVSFATTLKEMGKDIVIRVNASLVGAKEVFDMLTNLGLPDIVALELIELARGLTPEDLKAKTPRARKFLQFLGTEAFRVHVDDLYWVKLAAEKIQRMSPETKVVFIPDCRFINEADYIRKIGGLLWRVERLNKGCGHDKIARLAIRIVQRTGVSFSKLFQDEPETLEVDEYDEEDKRPMSLIEYLLSHRCTDAGTPFDNGLTAEQKLHPSETQLDGYPTDATLVAADMDELFHAVRKQIEQLQKDGKL